MEIKMKKAYLALADGTVFCGESLGAEGETIGEIVFNTGMTGYQEVLTDPSYAGQIVTMTYPLIGNYGINSFDNESYRSFVKGFIVKECADLASNFRCEGSLNDYLKKNNIVAISGIDTRALTKKLRTGGTMNGIISTADNFSFEGVRAKIDEYKIIDAVNTASCKEKHSEGNGRYKVALMDYGLKQNIVRSLVKRDCTVTVYPSMTTAEEVLSDKPDGIMLSNGPGDPEDCVFQIEQIKRFLKSSVPMFGICLGHQLTAIAAGGKTGKLKYGHRGANHPVKDLKLDRTYITSQNHGYAVIADSLDEHTAKISHINMNDGTVEGVEYKNAPVFTVQFHPEASPGPHDTAYLFDKFIEMLGGGENA